MMQYPLDIGFKIATIGTRVRVTDAAGREVAYARKKKFKLKEDVQIYEDEAQSVLRFRLKADRVVDFGAGYAISGPNGLPLGSVHQQGMRSLWKSAYDVVDTRGETIGSIGEENPWVKVLDGLAEALPFGDGMGGLFFNPAYTVDLRGRPALRLTKQRSLFESHFRLEKLADLTAEEEDLLLASILMMVMLERDRG